MSRNAPQPRYFAPRQGDHAKYKRRRRWPWITLASVVVVLGVAGVVGYLFAREAVSVKNDLMAAKSKLSGVTSVVKTGDTAKLDATTKEILRLTSHANTTVQGPLWDFAAKIPLVGQNVSAVKGTTQAVDVLAREAMPPAMQLLSTLDMKKLKLADGGINLDPFKNAVAVLPTLNTAFADAKKHVAGIDRTSLLPVVDSSIGQLLDIMDQAGPALADLQKNLPTLLKLAGSDGPRTYIVLFQNNAEIRATGGNAATNAVIAVDNGKIQMLDDKSTKAFKIAGYGGKGSYDPPQAAAKLYEGDFTTNAQNYPRTPDFPTTAQMFAALWKTTTKSDTAGVISIDPVALSYMLAVTGPVKLKDGSSLTSENVVKVLLSDTYEKFGTNGLAADAYFADAASRIFKKISSGGWNPTKMLAALEKGVKYQRVYAWFPSADEQAVVASYGVDGALAADNKKATQVGVYLNDSSYSKLEYYLKTKTDVTCNVPARTVTTTVTLTNTLSRSDISGYALGYRNNSLGLPRTTMILDVLGFAVPGGKITSDPAAGDLKQFTRTGTENGRDAKSITVTVPKGKTKTVAYTSTLPDGPLGPLEVRFSPTVTDTPVTIAPECGSLFQTRD